MAARSAGHHRIRDLLTGCRQYSHYKSSRIAGAQREGAGDYALRTRALAEVRGDEGFKNETAYARRADTRKGRSTEQPFHGPHVLA